MADIFDSDIVTERAVREAFAKSIEEDGGFPRSLRADWVETPLGALLAVGDGDHLYLLAFISKTGLMRKAALLQKSVKAGLEMGESATVKSIKRELGEYFGGKRRVFETPLKLIGTTFQVNVWEELRKIPFGHTISYTALAAQLGKPAAFRAVAQASSQNPVAIAVPCHRAINASGDLGGYSGGGDRKRWLLNFEKEATGKNPG